MKAVKGDIGAVNFHSGHGFSLVDRMADIADGFLHIYYDTPAHSVRGAAAHSDYLRPAIFTVKFANDRFDFRVADINPAYYISTRQFWVKYRVYWIEGVAKQFPSP